MAGVCGGAAAEAEDAERGGSSSDSAERAAGGGGRVVRVRVEVGLVGTLVPPPAIDPPANLKLLLAPLSSILAAARCAAFTAGGGAFVLPNAALCPAFFPFVTRAPALASTCGSGLCACPLIVESDEDAVPARVRGA